MRFSIIVPIYNVEQYIELCLRSIVNQQYPSDEFEILVIDDCSPDNSINIVKQIQKIHSNIRIIRHKENLNLGGARNTGIREAKGDWLLFVDSDDALTDEHVLESLSLIIKNAPCDNVIIKSYTYSELDGQQNNPSVSPIATSFITGEEYLLKSEYLCNVWSGCYRRQFILDNAIYFREHIAYEDTDWSVKTFYYAPRIALVDYPFYCYRYNYGSITNRPDRRSFIDNIKSRNAAYDFIKTSGMKGQCKDICMSRLKKEVLGLIKTTRNYSYKDSTECVRYIKHSTDLLNIKHFKPSLKDSFLFFLLEHTPRSLTGAVKAITLTKRVFLKIIR